MADGYFLALIHGLDRQCHRLSVNRIHLGLNKVNLSGNHNMDGLAADDFIAQQQIDFHVAVSAGGEFAIFSNGCPSCIGNSPGSALRKFCSITSSADTARCDLHGAAHSDVVRGSVQNCMVECSGAGSSRNHEQGGADRT